MKEYAMTHRHLPSDAKRVFNGEDTYAVGASEFEGAGRAASSASPLMQTVLLGRGRYGRDR